MPICPYCEKQMAWPPRALLRGEDKKDDYFDDDDRRIRVYRYDHDTFKYHLLTCPYCDKVLGASSSNYHVAPLL
ncbi:MAG: hypothetical protein ACFFCS_12665 [Candidatus Hodarchaeota archaeon]